MMSDVIVTPSVLMGFFQLSSLVSMDVRDQTKPLLHEDEMKLIFNDWEIANLPESLRAAFKREVTKLAHETWKRVQAEYKGQTRIE